MLTSHLDILGGSVHCLFLSFVHFSDCCIGEPLPVEEISPLVKGI